MIPKLEVQIEIPALQCLFLDTLGAGEWTAENRIEQTSCFCEFAGQQQQLKVVGEWLPPYTQPSKSHGNQAERQILTASTPQLQGGLGKTVNSFPTSSTKERIEVVSLYDVDINNMNRHYPLFCLHIETGHR